MSNAYPKVGAIDYDALALAGDLYADHLCFNEDYEPADLVQRMATTIRILRAELESLQNGLKDPATVLVNMMRGHIANPHADTAKRNDELCTENEALRAALAVQTQSVANRDAQLLACRLKLSDAQAAMEGARRAPAYAYKSDPVLEIAYLKLDDAIASIKGGV